MLSQPRNKIIELLNWFETSDSRELADVKKIIELVTKHENIFIRDCLEAHLTGSALVVNPTTQKILLHNHKKLNKWLQFGGHADGETDLAKVAMKEAKEESGLTDLEFYTDKPIDIEVQIIPEKKGIPAHLHLDFRYLIFTQAEKLPKPAEHESQDLKFLSFSEGYELGDKLDYALMRLIKKAAKVI
ncbi:MAG: NUDIX hydrolase [Patescibacteria group bacterium]